MEGKEVYNLADEKAIALDKLARALNKLRDTGLPLNDWQAGKKYKVNYPVLHENKIYRCIETHTASSTFDETKWETVSNADSGLKTWVENTLYKTGDIVVYGSGIYQCITEHTSTSTFDTANWTNLSVGYVKKTLYTSNVYNTESTTITTSESMLNKDFIIIKIAYSIDGTSVKMNKSYVLAPVVGEVHDFSYQESTTSYIVLTGKILNNTTLQFNFTEAQNLTKFKIISIDSLSIGDKAGTTLYSDTPIGTIISYMGNNPPKDYLSCDGTVYNINDYQALADFINTEFGSYDFFGGDGTTTFAVPDLRGEFLRGTGTNSHTNQGSGANVGVHQDGTEANKYWVNNNTVAFPALNSTTPISNISNDDASISSDNVANFTKTVTLSGGWNEVANNRYISRPTNTSVLYCIKYTNSNLPEKIDIWTANTSYSVGNIVIYNDKIYKCITANNDSTFTPLNWVCLSATGEEDIGHVTFGYELQSGYLPLDGSTYNRADYADLITWVDTNSLWASTATDYGKFGTGDGTTTFTTPNFTGKFIECDDGTDVGDYTSAGLPNITGVIGSIFYQKSTESTDGNTSIAHNVWEDNKYRANPINNTDSRWGEAQLNASRQSSIYGNSTTVQPESIKLIPQIKYRRPNKSLPVKAVRRTLWEGEVGNKTGDSSGLTFTLNDAYYNYDVIQLHMYATYNANESIIRYLTREITKESIETLLSKISTADTKDYFIATAWGYSSENNYFDIRSVTNGTLVTINCLGTVLTKVVGIKYINENQYSTEEQLVGTWIDGKPLYQKTYSFNATIDGNEHSTIQLPSGYDKIIEITGTVYYAPSATGYIPVNAQYNSVYTMFVDAWSGYLRYKGNGWTGTWPMYVTIKYTKTTD